LADDSLIYCDQKVLSGLCNVLTDNQSSALTLIDLSRNIHSIDDNLKFHKALLQALKQQKKMAKPELVAVNSDKFLEQITLTTRSEDVKLLYEKAYAKQISE